MKSRHIIALTLGTGLFVLAIFVFRPVPIVTEDEAITFTGIVAQVTEGTSYDIVISFKETDQRFYINRGLERGLELNSLSEKIQGKTVEIKYPKYWTPLNPTGGSRHASKLSIGNEVLFNELKPSN